MIKGLKDKLIREGILFRKQLDSISKSEKFSKQEIKNYQDEQLKKIIKYSYNNVPYYKELFDANKLSINDIKSQDDLWKIPILTKNDVKINFNKLKSSKYPKQLLNLGNTSGTTGTPLKIYRDINSIIFENATVWRQWNWAGVKTGDNIAVLRGERIISQDINNSPYWLYDKITKRLKLSPIHIKDENMDKYIDAINHFECRVLQAYPSNAYILAQYLIKNNKQLKLEAVFTSSEPLHLYQRETIEKAFQCKVWDFYGMAERVVSASECSNHNGLHINEEYGITEFLYNNEISKEKGTIVGTTLHNYGMPLIRYRTGDFAQIKDYECKCGSKHRLINPIETKSEDMIITRDGKYISPSTVTHIFKPLKNISESQIIQHDEDNYEIRIVEDGVFSKENKNILEKRAKELVGTTSNVHVNVVSKIERTSSGKFRWIISNVKKR